MNSVISLYEYFQTEANTKRCWEYYLSSSYSNYLAYAEFNCYILVYAAYAKEHYPDVYQEIMTNEAFKQAYRTIEAKYRSLLTRRNEQLKEFALQHEETIEDGYLTVQGDLHQIEDPYFDELIAWSQKPIYQAIYQELVGDAAEATGFDSEIVQPMSVERSAAVSEQEQTDHSWLWGTVLCLGIHYDR